MGKPEPIIFPHIIESKSALLLLIEGIDNLDKKPISHIVGGPGFDEMVHEELQRRISEGSVAVNVVGDEPPTPNLKELEKTVGPYLINNRNPHERFTPLKRKRGSNYTKPKKKRRK